MQNAAIVTIKFLFWVEVKYIDGDYRILYAFGTCMFAVFLQRLHFWLWPIFLNFVLHSVPTCLDSGLWHGDVDAYRSPVYCSFNTHVTYRFSVQRFIMLLTEHLVRCETGSVDISTPWYKNCIERLQQIFLMVKHSHTYTHRHTDVE